MRRRSVILLSIALAAGVLGFTGVMGTNSWLAYGPFIIAFVLFVLSLFLGAEAGRQDALEEGRTRGTSKKA